MAGSGDEPRWRVFVSHTSELREFPKGNSYVAAVERAITAVGHVIVDMRDFPGASQPPADLCAGRVRRCDVYIGILGTRYGTPVPGRPEVSYTELEFETATKAGLDRLVFLLDTDADVPGIPASQLIDREFGERQDAFRDRVTESHLTTQSFASPAALQLLVERSLRELADTRRRIGSGLQREQVPAEPQPVRVSRFVNPPPAIAPAWFQGRQAETDRLAGYLTDPGIRLVTVTGPGGIGKTALVCRLLRGLEAGRIPGADAITVGGIVYLSRNGVHKVEYPTLVADLLRLLPADEAGRLQHLHQNPQHRPAEMMLALLEAFPAGKPVIVLLDNLESVMDTEYETLAEPALHEAVKAVLTGPAHAITIIATTRVTPKGLLQVEPARQRQLPLTEGLKPRDARIVLKELDDDGRLGLRDASDDLLDSLCQRTRGFPRALEAVKAILEADQTLTPRDLLDRTPQLPEDQIVQVLVGEAYERLDRSAQRVMQALSVFLGPVSAVGVDFLLRPTDPTIDAAPILTRLLRRQMIRFQEGHYSLHPLDREYARAQLPVGGPSDPPTTFTVAGLQARAADYYVKIRTPRDSWHTLEDVRPQLAEFELRCAAGDYDTAVTVLSDIDGDYLRVWGQYRLLLSLHLRVNGHISDPHLDAQHLSDLGFCYSRLGDYRQAVVLASQALTIDRQLGNRGLEAARLGNLGLCYWEQGDFRRAIELYSQALDISRNTGNRQSEATTLSNLGNSHDRLGDYREAIELISRALAISREIGYRRGECYCLAKLGQCRAQLGDHRQAVQLYTQALALNRDVRDRYFEAVTLAELGGSRLALDEAGQAIALLRQAVNIADVFGLGKPASKGRSGLARAHLRLGEPKAALAASVDRRDLCHPHEEPAIRLLKGLALLELDRVEDSEEAFAEAIEAAGALLALADRNVAALEMRALALSGLAVVTDDLAQANEAAKAFVQARAVTRAPGVAADTRHLFGIITAHDYSGLLSVLDPG